MLKGHKVSPFVKYEKVINFAREAQIELFEGYYMKPKEILSNRTIPLYVMKLEEVTMIYYLTVSASDWVRENLNYNINDNIVMIPEDFMYKFDLVRVIPEGGIPPIDSFLRIMLKQIPENAKLYSIEEELSGENWKPEN